MKENNQAHTNLFEALQKKTVLKQEVYDKTLASFHMIQKTAEALSHEFDHYRSARKLPSLPFEANVRGNFELELKFGGDVLIFLMHSNIFEMPRQHKVMLMPYVKEDPNRSYCGIINIYNFLADSFKYDRINDVGYLIGRILVNHEGRYFIEGKRELGFLYNNFGKHLMTQQSVDEILEAAINYTLNFDLLTPPYDQVKEVSVNEMKNTLDSISLKTGKRLGFQFYQD